MSKFSKAYKYQGTGNDFVLFDSIRSEALITPKEAIFLCNRHFGVGADGVLTLLPSKKADFFMHIYNADGSVAEMCGNGIRCAVKHFVDFYLGRGQRRTIIVETKKGVHTCEYSVDDKGVKTVIVNMGAPMLEPQKIPIKAERNTLTIKKGNRIVRGMALSMGNPHFVSFGDFNSEDVYVLGPFIERHSLFPRFTNVELANVKDKRNAEVFVWERGVGVTLACGSGACAVVVAGVKQGLLDGDVFVKVRLMGGVLKIKYDTKSNEVIMEGEVKRVFGIEFQ
ncbi:MAG: diaminopimelate epimerase [Deltaproteobacteria bacterium]|nr:diaminopimelate epimerase [Deltaproteobacteria bacterium]